MTRESTQTIATLNDELRRRMGRPGLVVKTPGVAGLDPIIQAAIVEKVRSFDGFTADNDPYGEHDFGAFENDGEQIFWKIEYFSPDMESGSENPTDPQTTLRVLTIMLASEY
jgi:hypothetical protein